MDHAQSSSQPIYVTIAEDVIDRIQKGVYEPGERLMTIAQMCEEYDVSIATAQRSVNLLADRGVVQTVPRKGVYVAGRPRMPELPATQDVRRLVVVESVAHRSGKSEPCLRGFCQQIVDAVVDAGRVHQIPLRFEYIASRPMTGEQTYFVPEPGDALLVVGNAVGVTLMSHLETPNVRSVVVDVALPNTAAVLTDNYLGMSEVAGYLSRKGHRRVVLAAGFGGRPDAYNTTNENERRDGMVLASVSEGLELTVEQSGDWDSLFALLESEQRPTAVAFTRDLAAIEFIRLAHKRGLRVPQDISVIGFDDWAHGSEQIEELTTMRVDLAGLGRAAVSLLLNPPSDTAPFSLWHRVAPSLIERGTVSDLSPVIRTVTS